jgi:hypothetical protein
MRIGDLLYFAPNLTFDKVDLNGPRLPEQFELRMTGFYIDPAEECARSNYAFAAGVLLVSAIDALARLRFGDGVGMRFTKFVRDELQSFKNDGLARRLYYEFRNGLVHEARLKKGGQFSLKIETTVEQLDGLLLVNPKCLAKEVRKALDSYVALLGRDELERRKLAKALMRDHSDDFRVAKK